jgi:hypothetical protein
LEISESVLQLLYLSPGQFSLRSVSALPLLTITRSQVRVDIGAKIFVLKFSWRIQGCPPIMIFPWYEVVFILCPWLLFSQDGSLLDGYLYLWSMNRIGVTLKPLLMLEPPWESPSFFGLLKRNLIVSPFFIGSVRPIVILINPLLLILDP